MDDTHLANELVRLTSERDQMIYWLLALYAERPRRRPNTPTWQRVRRALEGAGYPPGGDRAARLLELGQPELEDDHDE